MEGAQQTVKMGQRTIRKRTEKRSSERRRGDEPNKARKKRLANKKSRKSRGK